MTSLPEGQSAYNQFKKSNIVDEPPFKVGRTIRRVWNSSNKMRGKIPNFTNKMATGMSTGMSTGISSMAGKRFKP